MKIDVNEIKRKELIEIIDNLKLSKSNIHIAKLISFFSFKEIDIKEIIEYGIYFLPKIKDSSGKINLDLLVDYHPEIVGYFDVLGELSFLPEKIKDLCIELSIYADGESIQIDDYYYSYDPEEKLKGVLQS